MANETEHDWLKRMFPRGLYGRAALILFLPIVVVTLVVSIMFLQRHFEDVAQQMTRSMAHELGFVATRVERSDTAHAALRAAQAVAAPLNLTVQLPAVAAEGDARKFYDFSGRIVIRELRASLPKVIAIDLATDSKRVTVTMMGKFGPYAISFDRERVSASNPHQLLVLMIFTSLLMSGIATIFLRNQLRPIRRLARVAEAYGRGRVEPYRPGGAIEIRSAGTAFLDMRSRLERQNEQRKMMLSGISHDLRTPLTRLRLGLSMLSPGMASEPDDITAMEKDIAEMDHMLDAFLDYARDDARESPAEEIDPFVFLRDIVTGAQRVGQNVHLAEFQGATQPVSCRPEMLRRALDNLIGNAVRHGTSVEIDAALGARSLRIGVEDNGPGIAEEDMEMALRPFTQLDSSRNRNNGQGAGLGLAIAADVVRSHGGQLRLSRGEKLGGLRAEIVIPR